QPPTVVIAPPRGETIVPLTLERGSAAVAAPLLSGPLGLTVALEGSRATVILAGATFVFQLGAPFVRAGGVVYGLVGEPYLTRDTLFLPLHWLADCVPRALGARYHWNPTASRFEELPVAGAVAAAPPSAAPAPSPVAPVAPAPPPAGRPAAVPHPLTGLRHHHAVVIDPGHGGADPGNPGRYFSGGLVEKDITLAVARPGGLHLERPPAQRVPARVRAAGGTGAGQGRRRTSGRRPRGAAGGLHGADHGAASGYPRRDRVRDQPHRWRVSRIQSRTAQDRLRDRRRYRRVSARVRA